MSTQNPIIEEETGPPKVLGPGAAPKLDYEEYREQLAKFKLTKEQENELLSTLWDMMRTMVDIGFGLDSVQMVIPAFMKNALGSDCIELEGIVSEFNLKAARGNSK